MSRKPKSQILSELLIEMCCEKMKFEISGKSLNVPYNRFSVYINPLRTLQHSTCISLPSGVGQT